MADPRPGPGRAVNDRGRRLAEAAWIAGLCGAAVAAHLTWAAWDHSPMRGDDAALLRYALCIYHGPSVLTVPATCLPATPYPPLVPVWTAVWFHLVGPGVETAQQSLWPFHALAVSGLYGAVRRSSTVLAASATVAVATIGWCLGGSEEYFTEIALAGFGAVALAGWVWSEGGRRVGPLVLCGLALGLGLLSKWSFAFFFGPVGLLWALVAAARPPGPLAARIPSGIAVLLAVGACVGWLSGRISGELSAFLGGISAILLAIGAVSEAAGPRAVVALALPVGAVAGAWYVSHADLHRAFFATNVAGSYSGGGIPLAVSWPFYPVAVVQGLGLPFVVASLVGLVAALYTRRAPAAGWGAVAAFFGLLALAWAPYRAARYASPALLFLAPAAALPFAWRGVRAWQILLLVWGIWFPLGAPLTGLQVPLDWRPTLAQRPYPAGQDVRALNALHHLTLLWFVPVERRSVLTEGTDLAGMTAALLADVGDRPATVIACGVPNHLNLGFSAEVMARDWQREIPVEFVDGPSAVRRAQQTGSYLYLVEDPPPIGIVEPLLKGWREVWRRPGKGRKRETLWAPPAKE